MPLATVRGLDCEWGRVEAGIPVRRLLRNPGEMGVPLARADVLQLSH